jgi:glucoamylase
LKVEESLQVTVPGALEGHSRLRSQSRQKVNAFGRPGIEPRWTHGDKDGVGTAYAAASRIWFTLWNGIITEVYYPTVDHPQIRDLQCLITDGKTFFHEEKRDLKSICERLSGNSLGYRYTNTDSESRYSLYSPARSTRR